MARSIDDLLLLLRVLAQPCDEDPLSRPLHLPPLVSPPRQPPRVAWSRDLGGLPVDPGVSAVLDRFRTELDLLGWEIVDDEPDFSGADECFVTLRAFSHVERGRALGERVSLLKETVQDEIARGRALSADEVSAALTHLNTLWRRSIDFFDRYDLLIGPVTQVSPFPVEEEYPTSVAGVPMNSYIEWMRSCCRITTTGCPALSIPAGFVADGPDAGLPVGAQLVARPWGDADLLAMAKAIEATTGHGNRWPTELPAAGGSGS
jgi:amidase